MYKIVTVEDTVRVPPRRFGEDLEAVIISELKNMLTGRINRDIGLIISVTNLQNVGEGRIILGDGAVYYDVRFDVLTYVPLLNEVVEGIVSETTEFGAFITFGPLDGLLHVSQMTEDYMSYDEKNLSFHGKESKKTLKLGDTVRARVVTVSIKDRISTSKIGLTMRQPFLGKPDWLVEEETKKAGEAAKPEIKAAKKDAVKKEVGKKEASKKEPAPKKPK